MTMFCTRNYGNGFFQAVVCDGRIASEIDDEEFESYYDSNGKKFELRQHGMAEIATNPTDSLSDEVIQQSLSRAIQNATDFESKASEGPMAGQFISRESRFVEHQQRIPLAFTTVIPEELPTFTRSLAEIRSFEDLVYGQGVSLESSNSKIARLSEDLISHSAIKRLWRGLFIPVCFKYLDTKVVGIVEFPDTPDEEANVKWVDGPVDLVSGTELFCLDESITNWRFAIVK
jgi:hypothetical protein